MSCLDDETVLGLVEGRLAPPRLATVDDHLDGCETCRDVVAVLARTRSGPPPLEEGRALGRYIVARRAGAGAMGTVYEARDGELARRVAIKVLADGDPGARARLLREAQAMARVDHPNVVGVHEVGATDDGQVFVVMDFVEGATLSEWAAAPRPQREVVRVLAELARGLAAIHAAGLIHRDVKPANVIISADGRARIADFGLARAEQSLEGGPGGAPVGALRGAPRGAPSAPGALAGSIALALGTPATSIAGTPAYMAPEVLRGGPTTAASEQFSFGVTAYEALAGARPFLGSTWSEQLAAIESSEVAPVRRAPRWLNAALRRCLAVAPERRFSSLAEVAALLDERGQRRRRTAWLAGAAAAAALASGATWLAVRGEPSPAPSCGTGGVQIGRIWGASQRARLAVLGDPALRAIDGWTAQWAAERDAACEAATLEPARVAAREGCLDRRRDELAALLARAAQPGARGERLADALAELAPSECRSVARGAPDPLPLDAEHARGARAVQASLVDVRAAIALGDARPVAATAGSLVERAQQSGHGPTLAEALLAHAEALRATADLPAASAAARDAVVAAERGHDDLAAARAWLVRVAIAGERRELTSADDFGAIAAGAVDRAGAPPRLAGQLLRLRALVALNRGRYDDARALLGDARARFVAVSGERSIDVAGIESALGMVARERGELDAAERHHRAALALDRELRGPRHPDVARDLHNLAGVLRRRPDLDGAAAAYREALAIFVEARGPTSADAGLTRNSLGLLHMERKDWPAARAELERARDALTAAGHGDAAFSEHNLGLVAAATGDPAAALAHYLAAGARYASTRGADAPQSLQLLVDRARAELALGDRASARQHAEAARTGATAANLRYVVDEADALLASLAPRTSGAPRTTPGTPSSAFVIEPPPPISPDLRQPERTPESPVPRPPLAPTDPQPRRDVGTYGASQGWASDGANPP